MKTQPGRVLCLYLFKSSYWGWIWVAEKTLRNWRYKGVYPQIFVKLGGKVFVDLEELAKIVAVQQKKAKRLALRHDL